MKTLNPFLQVIRPLNLLIIAMTQILFWVYIVLPVYAFFQEDPTMNWMQVAGIVVSTVLIAAGGYVINDYYDVPIDLVNKPDNVLITDSISDEAAFNYYIALTAAGLITALAAAISIGQYDLVILPLIMAGLMWFYAQKFKRTLIIGNLIVSVATTAVIFILLLFEVDWAGNSQELSPQTNEILKFGLGYMGFAFGMTLFREIVKDLQDRAGDAEFECRTMPVVWGERTARAVALLIGAVNLAFIAYLAVELIMAGNVLAFSYLLVFLILPFLVAGFKLWNADESGDYKKVSNWIKAMMLFGILTMIYIGIILGKHG